MIKKFFYTFQPLLLLTLLATRHAAMQERVPTVDTANAIRMTFFVGLVAAVLFSAVVASTAHRKVEE